MLAFASKILRSRRIGLVNTARQEKHQRSDTQLSERRVLAIMRGQLRTPPENPSDHHSTMVLRVNRGPLIGPPLCREPPVSWTADVNFSNVELRVVLLNFLFFSLQFSFLVFPKGLGNIYSASHYSLFTPGPDWCT